MTRVIELMLVPVKLYQRAISPLMLSRCKYHPTCSTYAIDALRSHGPLRGGILAVWRLLRCNPFSNGGIDPVEAQQIFRAP